MQLYSPLFILRAVGSHVVPVLRRIHGSLAPGDSRSRSGSSSRRRRTPSATTPSPGPAPSPPSRPAKRHQGTRFPYLDVFGALSQPPPPPPLAPHPKDATPKATATPFSSRVYYCDICCLSGHDAGDCPQLKLICFCCGSRQHLIATCPYRGSSCTECHGHGHVHSVHHLVDRDTAVLRTFGLSL